jgi:hypothetical protein
MSLVNCTMTRLAAAAAAATAAAVRAQALPQHWEICHNIFLS